MIADGFWRLWCEMCTDWTDHHVWPEERGERVAECQRCEASWPIRGRPTLRTGHPRGARGRFKVHDWIQGVQGRWFRQCMPFSLSRSAAAITKAAPSPIHPLCDGCKARREAS